MTTELVSRNNSEQHIGQPYSGPKLPIEILEYIFSFFSNDLPMMNRVNQTCKPIRDRLKKIYKPYDLLNNFFKSNASWIEEKDLNEKSFQWQSATLYRQNNGTSRIETPSSELIIPYSYDNPHEVLAFKKFENSEVFFVQFTRKKLYILIHAGDNLHTVHLEFDRKIHKIIPLSAEKFIIHADDLTLWSIIDNKCVKENTYELDKRLYAATVFQSGRYIFFFNSKWQALDSKTGYVYQGEYSYQSLEKAMQKHLNKGKSFESFKNRAIYESAVGGSLTEIEIRELAKEEKEIRPHARQMFDILSSLNLCVVTGPSFKDDSYLVLKSENIGFFILKKTAKEDDLPSKFWLKGPRRANTPPYDEIHGDLSYISGNWGTISTPSQYQYGKGPDGYRIINLTTQDYIGSIYSFQKRVQIVSDTLIYQEDKSDTEIDHENKGNQLYFLHLPTRKSRFIPLPVADNQNCRPLSILISEPDSLNLYIQLNNRYYRRQVDTQGGDQKKQLVFENQTLIAKLPSTVQAEEIPALDQPIPIIQSQQPAKERSNHVAVTIDKILMVAGVIFLTLGIITASLGYLYSAKSIVWLAPALAGTIGLLGGAALLSTGFYRNWHNRKGLPVQSNS